MRAPKRIALFLAVAAAMVLGCFVDRGMTFVADNTTDQELVTRVTGKESPRMSSETSDEWRQDLAVLPAHSRLAIETLGFTDAFSVWTIEFLTSDCSVVATFDQGKGVSFAGDGSLFVIDPGPKVTLRREWPADGTLAVTTDHCAKLPGG